MNRVDAAASSARAAAAPRRHAASDLSLADLTAALTAGWADFRACPVYGLVIAGGQVAAGLLLAWLALSGGHFTLLAALAAGFPMVAPFAAVCLYEVSRRRAVGLPVAWTPVVAALKGHDDGQILGMGVLIFVAFGFWVMIAHGIWAIFVAGSGLDADPLAFLQTGAGIAMLLVGGAVGGLMALAFYAATLTSLPMLVDRPVDFVTAIIGSFATVRANPGISLIWAALVATLLFAAMLPLLLGLPVVLTVLGHATWHLYRRAFRADR